MLFPAATYEQCGAELETGAFLRVDGVVRHDNDQAVVVATGLTRDRSREGEFPELVNAPYVIGLGPGGRHAIAHAEASTAVAAANGDPARADAYPVCGQGMVRVVPKWGVFERANPRLRGVVCASCAWGIAVETGDTAVELDALNPPDDELAPRRRLLGDTLIAMHLCEAIIASADAPGSDYELNHPHTVQLLAAVTAHAPVLLVPEDCAEGDCDHRPDDAAWDDRSWSCPFPEASVACPACSLQSGGWDGEWEGQYLSECTVPSPCQALRTLAVYYRVPLSPIGPDPDAAEHVEAARAVQRVREFLAAHAENRGRPGRGARAHDVIATEHYHDGMGHAVAVLRADDLRALAAVVHQ